MTRTLYTGATEGHVAQMLGIWTRAADTHVCQQRGYLMEGQE